MANDVIDPSTTEGMARKNETEILFVVLLDINWDITLVSDTQASN